MVSQCHPPFKYYIIRESLYAFELLIRIVYNFNDFIQILIFPHNIVRMILEKFDVRSELKSVVGIW